MISSELAWKPPTRETLYPTKNQAFLAWAEDQINACLTSRLQGDTSDRRYAAHAHWWGEQDPEREKRARAVQTRWARLLEATTIVV